MVEKISSWCDHNNLGPNVSNGKKMVVDFRRRKQSHATRLTINEMPVVGVWLGFLVLVTSQDAEDLHSTSETPLHCHSTVQTLWEYHHLLWKLALRTRKPFIGLSGVLNVLSEHQCPACRSSEHTETQHLIQMLASGKCLDSIKAGMERLEEDFPPSGRTLHQQINTTVCILISTWHAASF